MQVFWRNTKPLGMLCLPRLSSQNLGAQFPEAQPQAQTFKATFGDSSEGDRQANPSGGLPTPSSNSYPPADCLFTSLCRETAIQNKNLHKHGAALTSHQPFPPQEQKFTPVQEIRSSPPCNQAERGLRRAPDPFAAQPAGVKREIVSSRFRPYCRRHLRDTSPAWQSGRLFASRT